MIGVYTVFSEKCPTKEPIYIYIVLGGVVMVVGLSLARSKIFTAAISSIDSLYVYMNGDA